MQTLITSEAWTRTMIEAQLAVLQPPHNIYILWVHVGCA